MLDTAEVSDAALTDASDATFDAADVSDAALDADAARPVGTLEVASSALDDTGQLPPTYACSGPSPPLQWTAGPSETRSYAVVGDPFLNSGTWLMHDIAPNVLSLAEGAATNPPDGAINSQPYVGPCPVLPSRTNYADNLTIRVYALPVAHLQEGTVDALMATHPLAIGELMTWTTFNTDPFPIP